MQQDGLPRDLEPAFSTKGTSGPILVTVLGMVAEIERKFIRERQQAGIEAAKAKGIYRGRKPPTPAFGLRCWPPHALRDRERHPVLMQFGETQKARLPLPPMPCLDAARHVLLHTLRSSPLVQPTTG